jgi:serine protease
MAPGGDTSTDANGDGYVDGVLQETDIGSGWGYYFFQGTSMASPHVAAVAAMLIANKSAITPDEVYQALTSTALDLGNPGFDSTYGYGLVQAHSAIQATSGNSNLDPTASFSFSCTDLSCEFDANGSSDSDGSISSYDWNFGDDSTGTGLTTTHTYANSGTYTVTLTVWDNDGASGMSSQDVDVTVATSNTPPVTPVNVSAIDNSDGTARIDWADNSNDEEGFQVEREKQNKRGQWKGRSVVATTEPDMTSIDDPSGTGTFRYRIGAFNSAGISWSSWREVTVTNTGSDGGSGSTPSKGYCKKNPDDPACP